MFPWLKQRDVAVIAHDASMEGGRIPEQGLPMHAITMVALGMPLIDHMALDDLSIAMREDAALGLHVRDGAAADQVRLWLGRESARDFLGDL